MRCWGIGGGFLFSPPKPDEDKGLNIQEDWWWVGVEQGRIGGGGEWEMKRRVGEGFVSIYLHIICGWKGKGWCERILEVGGGGWLGIGDSEQKES